MITYIADTAHYNEVLSRVARVENSLWIGTADIKDLYVKVGALREPFLAVLDILVRRGVEVRLLHAKEPGPNFRKDFDRYPVLWSRLKRKLCPRVHFKMMIFDCGTAYIGSANLTGAGIGMKSDCNHFIELDRDDAGSLYLVIHTGSRNLCKQVAEIYQTRAVKHLTPGADELEQHIKQTIEEYKAAGRRNELHAVIKQMRREYRPPKPSVPEELCYVEGKAREEYLHDMRLCQRWAVLNRKLIAVLLLKFIDGVEIVEEFESIHNYISDDNMIRKGAISAQKGERCIIPLNMRDGSLLCTGRGNTDGTARHRMVQVVY